MKSENFLLELIPRYRRLRSLRRYIFCHQTRHTALLTSFASILDDVNRLWIIRNEVISRSIKDGFVGLKIFSIQLSTFQIGKFSARLILIRSKGEMINLPARCLPLSHSLSSAEGLFVVISNEKHSRG